MTNQDIENYSFQNFKIDFINASIVWQGHEKTLQGEICKSLRVSGNMVLMILINEDEEGYINNLSKIIRHRDSLHYYFRKEFIETLFHNEKEGV